MTKPTGKREGRPRNREIDYLAAAISMDREKAGKYGLLRMRGFYRVRVLGERKKRFRPPTEFSPEVERRRSAKYESLKGKFDAEQRATLDWIYAPIEEAIKNGMCP